MRSSLTPAGSHADADAPTRHGASVASASKRQLLDPRRAFAPGIRRSKTAQAALRRARESRDPGGHPGGSAPPFATHARSAYAGVAEHDGSRFLLGACELAGIAGRHGGQAQLTAIVANRRQLHRYRSHARRRMIARERRIVRCGDEQMRVARMGDVPGPRPLPDMGDDRHRKSECGTHASRHDAMTSVDRSPLAAEEQHSEQRDEEHLSLQREEPQRVLDAVCRKASPLRTL